MSGSADSLADLVRRWPQRFRFRSLLVALADGAAADEVARALLVGIAADQDEREVFDGLLAEGHFQVAETMLSECAALDEQEIVTLRRRLDKVRARRSQELQQRLRKLFDLAERSGLAFDPDQEMLERQCSASWPRTKSELDELERELNGQIAAKRAVLYRRIEQASGAEKSWSETCRGLVEEGWLKHAENLLDRRPLEDRQLSGPAAVERPPTWIWEESPQEVLRWHLDPSTRRPPAFSSWASREGDSAHRMLEAYDALDVGSGPQAAADFAAALDAFLLDREPEQKKVAPVEGGYLTTLSGVFADPEIKRFRPIGTVDLFIGGPDTRALPPLEGLAPYIAVGPSLTAPVYADRAPGAVLDLRALLRLAAVRSRRAVGLLRLVGEQWPLSAFIGESAATLDERLGDGGDRWAVLSWIVDLTGLGDAATAAILDFETGMDPRLIKIFLEFLDRSRSFSSTSSNRLASWSSDQQLAAEVEAAVLEPLDGSPIAEAGFWAALGVCAPGEPVSTTEISLAMAVVADSADDVPNERRLWSALAELAASPLVEEASPEAVRLRHCGALIHLRGHAEQRLTAAVRKLAAEQVDPVTVLNAWELHRHALAPSFPDYQALVGSEAPDLAACESALSRLLEETDELLSHTPRIEGAADFVAVLTEMRADYVAAHPDIELSIDAPSRAPVAVTSGLIRTLLYELLSNAADALGAGGGSVRVQVHPPSQGDLVIDVQDSGTGITYPPGSEHRIFRNRESTRGQGRGAGLYRARQLAQRAGGDLLLVSRSEGHPVLKGAHFRLIIPAA